LGFIPQSNEEKEVRGADCGIDRSLRDVDAQEDSWPTHQDDQHWTI
jgi:hypothetical protein